MLNIQLKVFVLSLLLFLPLNIAAISPERASEEFTVSVHQDWILEVIRKEQILPEKILLDVPVLLQFPELPRGCEVTSLAMMLNYAGIQVDKLTLAKEVQKVPYLSDIFNGNPHVGFVGNMYTYDEPGLAVFNGPIEELGNKYLPKKMVNFTGQDFSSIKKKLNEGKPVWVIVASSFAYLPEEHWETWTTKEGEMKISFKTHSVLVTGYDENKVYFNDPFKREKNQSAGYEEFVSSWVQFGRQAVSYQD